MVLNQRLYNLFKKTAREVNIDLLCLGLGYTCLLYTSDAADDNRLV